MAACAHLSKGILLRAVAVRAACSSPKGVSTDTSLSPCAPAPNQSPKPVTKDNVYVVYTIAVFYANLQQQQQPACCVHAPHRQTMVPDRHLSYAYPQQIHLEPTLESPTVSAGRQAASALCRAGWAADRLHALGEASQ